MENQADYLGVETMYRNAHGMGKLNSMEKETLGKLPMLFSSHPPTSEHSLVRRFCNYFRGRTIQTMSDSCRIGIPCLQSAHVCSDGIFTEEKPINNQMLQLCKLFIKKSKTCIFLLYSLKLSDKKDTLPQSALMSCGGTWQ